MTPREILGGFWEATNAMAKIHLGGSRIFKKISQFGTGEMTDFGCKPYELPIKEK